MQFVEDKRKNYPSYPSRRENEENNSSQAPAARYDRGGDAEPAVGRDAGEPDKQQPAEQYGALDRMARKTSIWDK